MNNKGNAIYPSLFDKYIAKTIENHEFLRLIEHIIEQMVSLRFTGKEIRTR